MREEQRARTGKRLSELLIAFEALLVNTATGLWIGSNSAQGVPVDSDSSCENPLALYAPVAVLSTLTKDGKSALFYEASVHEQPPLARSGRASTSSAGILQVKKIFQNDPSVGMLFIEQFRVKLHAEERTRAVLHRLDA